MCGGVHSNTFVGLNGNEWDELPPVNEDSKTRALRVNREM